MDPDDPTRLSRIGQRVALGRDQEPAAEKAPVGLWFESPSNTRQAFDSLVQVSQVLTPVAAANRRLAAGLGCTTGRAALAGCYHGVMTRKATTVRIPEELADTAEVVARARGVSVNTLILDALANEIDRVKQDKEFITLLRSHVERDKEILDRLAE